MSNIESCTSGHKHFVCHNGVDIYHCIIIQEGQQVESGQPYIDEYATCTEMLNALPEDVKDRFLWGSIPVEEREGKEPVFKCPYI